jgi:YedE family putative selenium metabolism protein
MTTKPPLLRSESRGDVLVGMVLALGVGIGAAVLVSLGNPGNMGVCGACFLRDIAGSLGLGPEAAPTIFRPEVAGVVLGALVFTLVSGRFVARSGSHAAARFLLGALMGIAALVFLGCPFRLLQRLGGGDLNAWVALPGFLVGVGIGLLFERRGYSVGRTSPAPAPVGLLGPLVCAGLLAAFLVGGMLRGPGPGSAAKPPHAPWEAALGIAFVAGALLSVTGFCAVSAARQVFLRRRGMLLGAAALVLGYALAAAVAGRFDLSWNAPLSHPDALWSFLALVLLGLTGALAGGCPVRQMVMTGEGNGDAFVTVAGIALGGTLAHAWGTVSVATMAAAAGGATEAGKTAVIVGLVVAGVYGLAVARLHARTGAPESTGG